MDHNQYIEAATELLEMADAGVGFSTWEVRFLKSIVDRPEPGLTSLQKSKIIELLEERS